MDRTEEQSQPDADQRDPGREVMAPDERRERARRLIDTTRQRRRRPGGTGPYEGTSAGAHAEIGAALVERRLQQALRVRAKLVTHRFAPHVALSQRHAISAGTD